MALSGTLTGSCTANNGASSRYDYKIEWSATQNVTANTSTITATAYVRSNNSAYSTSTNWTSIINGTTVKTFQYHVQASAGWVNFGSKTWTVNHNADGTCTTSISGSFSGTYNGSYVLRSGSVSGNITLNTIPRASSFSLNRTSGTIGTDNFIVTINRASSSFTHTVIYKFGSGTYTKANKTTATTVTVDVGIGDCSQIPNATSGTGTITVDTYNGSTKIGSASKTITLNVPSSVVPSIGSVTATGNNLLGSVYVAGKSTVTAKINSAGGSQGSTIKSYHLSGAGLNSASSSATSGNLSAGTHTITGKVTDSRGRTASKSTNITVHSYTGPTMSASVYRCNASGQAVEGGTYMRANITVNVDNVGNANVNAKQYKIEWKQSQNSSWSTYLDWTNLSSYSASWIHDLGGNWANTTSYDVRISVKDSYGTVSATRTIGTIACVLNVEEAGVGVGKIHERGALDVGGYIYTNGRVVVSGNSKEVQVGTGSTDVFIHNSASGKYLQLKDDGKLQYSDANILRDNWVWVKYGSSITGAIADGSTNRRIAVIASHGGVDLGDTGANTAICSANVPTWWNGTSSHTIYTTGNKPSPQDIGAMKTISANGYYGMTANGDANNWVRTTKNGIIPYQSANSSWGGANTSLGTTGWRFANGYIKEIYCNGLTNDLGDIWVTAKAGANTIYAQSKWLCPANNSTTYLGSSGYRWHSVWSANGTLQTSDERFKIKRGLSDLQDCFDMVKNTNIYNYVMINDNKEDLSKNRLGKLAMTNSGEDTNVQMGIMAQDIQAYQCGKHILVEGEYEKADGTNDTMLHINPYNMTTALMGAVKVEIEEREKLEEALKEEVAKRQALEEKVQSLEERLAALEKALSSLT